MVLNITHLFFGDNQQYNPFNYPANNLIDISTGRVRSDATLRYNQDWMDEMTAKNPLRQEYILSVSGGNEKSKYMYSLGYLNEEGILKTTSYERFTGRTNIDTELHKNIKGGLNLSYTRGKSNITTVDSNEEDDTSSASSNVFYTAQLMAPIYPVYELDASGNILRNEDGKALYDYGYDRPSGAQSGFNSIATLHDDKYGNTNDNISGRTYLEAGNFNNFLKGLKFTVTLGIDYQLRSIMTYYNPYFGNSAAVKGTIKKENKKLFSYTTNQILSYDRKFGDHHIDVLVGHEFYSYQFNYLAGTKTGFPFGGLYELDAATNISSVRSYEDLYRIQSALSRLNYDYQDKYYISLSYRRDGSSRFNKDNRWGDFWSAGASWRISQEAFMANIDWINNLTVKASYGVQGNDNILKTVYPYSPEYYTWQAFYDMTWANSSMSGAMIYSLENTGLKWEKNGNLNTGLETRLFNRLSATLEWYQRKTSDLLLNYPMATSTGFDGYWRNVGSMRNRGFEFALSGDIIRTKDFTWNLTIMGSTIRNKVLSLADRPEIVSGNYIIKEGEAINSFYVPVSLGVNPETGNQLFRVWDEDADGNRTYYESENRAWALQCREIAGSRIPDLYGSFTNDFRYKGFDLSILFTYSIGGKILDSVYRNMTYSYYVGQSIHADLARAWKEPGDITDIPRVQYSYNYTVTDKDLTNASYLSLKNITLGYTLPHRWMNAAGLDTIRIFATADNVFLFTHLKGMDPQYNFTGATEFVYTPTRVISLGLDIRF